MTREREIRERLQRKRERDKKEPKFSTTKTPPPLAQILALNPPPLIPPE
jgi:hypothetical protein